MMKDVHVRAYAKINLTLEILGVLPSGYHKIVSIMQQIDLHDDLYLSSHSDSSIEIQCDDLEVPVDDRNLVWQAVSLTQQRFGIKAGVSVLLLKQIPASAGLAGGSSNAAATIMGLNQLWNLRLSLSNMIAIGTEIGMDVPFCLLGGTALATDKGQELLALPAIPPCFVVLANPGIQISTAEAFGRLQLRRLDHACCRTLGLLAGITVGSRDSIVSNLHNDFEDVVLQQHPIVERTKNLMIQSGAENPTLSGSGPTVFCLTSSYSKACKIAGALKHSIPFVRIAHTRNL